MARFSLNGDDKGPSKRSRLSTSESSCSEETLRAKRRPEQTHPDEESCHHYKEEEEEEEEEDEEEEEEEEEEEGEEEEGRSASVSVKPDDENPRLKPLIIDLSISAVITDPDVLDCCICFEPLTIPVFQCENGHIACSSCCTDVKNKCPSCSWPIGYNRCRAIEKVLESVKVACQNKQHGCEERVTYSNKKDHDSNCLYTPLECPLSYCHFVSSYRNLYSHFTTQHRYSSYAARFTYNLGFRVTLDKVDKFIPLQEKNEGVLFILNCEVESVGHSIWLNCVSPLTSMAFKYDVFAKNEDASLKLQSTTMFTRGQHGIRPSTGFLLVPSGFFGSSSTKNFSFDLCIYGPGLP